MKFVKFVTIIFVFFLHGCSTSIFNIKPTLPDSQKEQWSMIIGKWLGDQPTKEGGRRLELIENYSDGTYKITFRTIDKDGKISDQLEFGQWGVSGSVMFTFYLGTIENGKPKTVDPANPSNQDAYKIISLDKKQFVYEHLGFGDRYINTKVPDNYELPNFI